ncbi:putative ribonuclease H-like domain-containing protein [Tanacetum coccineum]
MSFDDLYNNFKIVKQEVKRSVTSISNSSLQNMAFVSSPNNTNDVNTANVQISTASTPISTASTSDNSANLSDATVYAFLANQPNGSQLVHEDLEQIHKDDLEEMDLKWQLALLSMRARKYYQRTSKKITINGSDTAGYDKSKVECFNFHKIGHFARECRGPRNQDSRPRNQESSRKTMNVEDTSTKAMIAIDGAGFDWSFMADEEVPTNMALMAFSYLEFNKSEFDLANYKRGLAFVEEQLVFYKKNEKDKESNQIKIDNFENASKSLDKLIGSQISDNNRKGVGFTSYNAIAPPPTGLFAPLSIDLSNSGLKEFQQPKFEGYSVKVNKSACESSSSEIKKTTDAPIIEDWVSDCDHDESEEIVTVNVQPKPKQVDQPRKVSQNPRNTRTNWNEMKTQKLGVGFQFSAKACFGTGQREVRPVWNNAMRTNHQNFSNSIRNFAPIAVLTKSDIVPISTARQISLRAATLVSTARPINTVVSKPFVNVQKPKPNAQKSHSLSKRPFCQQTALKNRILNNKVNTTKLNYVNTANGKRVTSAVGKQGINDVKSSACWVWRPKVNVVDHVSKNSGSYICKQFNYVDPTDYQDHDGGFVAFASSSKGGKITRKVNAGNRTNGNAGIEINFDAGQVEKEKMPDQEYIILPLLHRSSNVPSSSKEDESSPKADAGKKNDVKEPAKENEMNDPGEATYTNSTNIINTVSLPVNTVSSSFSIKDLGNAREQRDELESLFRQDKDDNNTYMVFTPVNTATHFNDDPLMPNLEDTADLQDTGIFGNAYDDKDVGAEADINNLETTMSVSPISTTRIHKDHPKAQIIGEFCGIKGIKREFSNARTPLQNGAAERKNRTLIEAAKTMLADSLLPILFWAKAVNTACYVLNRVLVTKPHNKTPYELLIGQAGKEIIPDQEYILLPLLHTSSNVPSNSKKDESSPKDDAEKKNEVKDSAKEGNMNGPEEATNTNSTNRLNIVSSLVNIVSSPVNIVSLSFTTVDLGRAKEQRNEYKSLFDPLIPDLEDTADLHDTGIFGSAYDDEYVGAEADLSNLETNMSVSPIPITRIHKDHPKAQIIGEVDSAVQTRRMHKQNEAGLISFINKQRRTNHKDFQNCLFACFLSQMEPKKTLVDLPHGKKVIGTKWVFRNKRDQRGIVVRNKARLVAQGYRQEEGVDYDEVFAPVARIEAIRLFLAFASFMGFTVYQMDVKSAFLYGTIEEEVYVNQPPGFVDPEFPNRVYKVEKALYGLHQAPRAWYETLSTYLLENGFRRGTIDKTLFIKKIKNDILLVQVYVDDIIFGSTKESLSTEFEQLMHKRFQMSSMGELTFFLGLQVEQRKDGIFLSQTIISMIGSLMYLTSSRPDIMFAVCACSRHQVQPKASHMHAVKRIFRCLKGKPTLGLWYPKDSPLDLIAYSDSDYAGASLDRKSTTGGCQFLVKNPVYHSKTKHIEITHHFIRDSYEKKLIEMVKIHTDYNVADLLTKAFDVTRFQFLIASIGMLNP